MSFSKKTPVLSISKSGGPTFSLVQLGIAKIGMAVTYVVSWIQGTPNQPVGFDGMQNFAGERRLLRLQTERVMLLQLVIYSRTASFEMALSLQSLSVLGKGRLAIHFVNTQR
jgi:hypothetical protein